jgi:hypothetical protein
MGAVKPPLPVLFLDVDGPLIPFGTAPPQYPDGYPTYRTDPGLPGADSNPLLTRINPALGPRLTALPCELVWATTWMDDANRPCCAFQGPLQPLAGEAPHPNGHRRGPGSPTLTPGNTSTANGPRREPRSPVSSYRPSTRAPPTGRDQQATDTPAPYPRSHPGGVRYVRRAGPQLAQRPPVPRYERLTRPATV